MTKNIIKCFLLALVLMVVACNKDGEIVSTSIPIISGTMNTRYEIKHNHKITIQPEVINGENATYEWLIDGNKVGSHSSYVFVGKQIGTTYIDFKVTTLEGRDSIVYRVDVVPLEPPVVVFEGRDDVIEVLAGTYTFIRPHYGGGEVEKYQWTLDGEECDETASFSAEFENVGDHTLSIKVSNEDGENKATTTLRVVEHLTGRIHFPPALISQTLESANGSTNNGASRNVPYRNVAIGHTLALAPTIENFNAPSYEWRVDGELVSSDEVLLFKPEEYKLYDVCVTVRDDDGYSLSANVEVECCDAEWTFHRSRPTNATTDRWNRVYEYIPAAGQFINEQKSGFEGVGTHAQAIAYAEKRMSEGEYVSLGGWGGVLVVGFDYSIDNGEGYDFSVKGNIHEGSSEPAIVWVMQDTNGNGQPDDVWYELRGSEYDSQDSRRRYAVTYFRPVVEQMSVWWSDNAGATGEIERMPQHNQPSYYPHWIVAENYTLYGSLLAPNTTHDGVNYQNNPYAWGYADNKGSDTLAEDSHSCGFDISNAVREDGEPMELGYIDFVKVQSAINHTAGLLGEVSAEVVDIAARRREQ